MQRIDFIFNDKRFRDRMNTINEREKDRIFCRHGFEHTLEVARLSYIFALENGAMEKDKRLTKDVIYATALLHDIGRFSELEEEMDHRQAGPILAEPILRDAGYTEEEVELINDAIYRHGDKDSDPVSLAGILYKADKLSRECFLCEAYDICNWPEEKKNHSLI